MSAPPPMYEPRPHRDPFHAPATRAVEAMPPSSFEGLKLVGVIAANRGRLALVESADGAAYLLEAGDPLGDGLITQITENSIRVAIATPRDAQLPRAITLRLGTDGEDARR